MKKITLILAACMVLFTSGLVSCMDDFDVPVTGNAYGNNNIKDGRTISIANLKKKYASVISANGLQQITEETRIEGVIVGDDESGNIYKQLMIADESGIIVIGINNTGLYATCPVGQKMIIDCEGLYIGGYGELGQLGSVYNGKVGRMPGYMWEEHVRLLGEPNLFYPELAPKALTAADLSSWDKAEAPILVNMNDVSFENADGEELYAEDKGGSQSAIEQNLVFEDGTKLVVRTSTYANFANDVLPQGKLNVTGLLSRYGNTWQLTLRSGEEVKRNN
mgnify:FL=1